MHKNHMFIAVVVALSSILAACQGGGSRKVVSGKACPSNYNPIPMDVPANQKTALEAALPVGTYEYSGASLYYKDPSDFRIEVVDVKQKNNSYSGSIGCVRNASKLKNDLFLATEGISKMTVEGNSNKVTSEIKSYGFNSHKSGISAAVTATERKADRPSDVYAGNVLESFLFKTDETHYEIRSHGKSQNGGDFYLAVRFIKK